MDQSRRNNFKSSFAKSTSVSAPVEFNMSAMDFPVIESTPVDNSTHSAKSTKLNYKAATIVQPPSSSESVKIIPQGCVEYTFNKQTKQIVVNYAKDYPHKTTKTIDTDVDPGEEYLYSLQRALATNWNMHNENYIECYGIDAYVHTFMIPSEKTDYDQIMTTEN